MIRHCFWHWCAGAGDLIMWNRAMWSPMAAPLRDSQYYAAIIKNQAE